jgi:Leucine-rich repeat (LRR) protein
LKNLEGLYLYDLKITVLPLEIGQLENLQALALWALRSVVAWKNQLTTLLLELGQLQNFQWLDLGCNQLTTLPPEIALLENLQELMLNANRLTALPPEIGRLKNLRKLNLEENKFAGLPPEMGQLGNLQELLMFDNRFTALPPEIAQLKKLQKLDLEANQLTAFPSEIAQLKSLEKISLWDNPIQDFSALAALANHPNQDLQVIFFGSPEFPVEIPRKYWTDLSQWKAEWLLTEKNAEIRRLLIQQIGYDRICEELQTIELDNWREYTLLKIDVQVDIEPIHLLKMTCPSTNHIYALRVPPDLTSARAAICWVNWDIDPENFAVET